MLKKGNISRRAAQQRAQHEAGLCIGCGEPHSSGMWRCFKCRVKDSERYRARKAARSDV